MKITKNKEDEISSEETLKKLIKTQAEDKVSNNKPLMGTTDKKVEAVLVFKLVCSLNQGNSGAFYGRVEMAKKQVEELEKLGYDLTDIYNSI